MVGTVLVVVDLRILTTHFAQDDMGFKVSIDYRFDQFMNWLYYRMNPHLEKNSNPKPSSGSSSDANVINGVRSDAKEIKKDYVRKWDRRSFFSLIIIVFAPCLNFIVDWCCVCLPQIERYLKRIDLDDSQEDKEFAFYKAKRHMPLPPNCYPMLIALANDCDTNSVQGIGYSEFCSFIYRLKVSFPPFCFPPICFFHPTILFFALNFP